MLFWLSVVLFITTSMYTVISGNPRSHAEYLVDSVNPVPKQVPRNCRNSKWSSLTWHLAHSASAFVTNQLIWISLNQRANSTWWGRTWKVWGRTRHKVGANSIGGERGAWLTYILLQAVKKVLYNILQLSNNKKDKLCLPPLITQWQLQENLLIIGQSEHWAGDLH